MSRSWTTAIALGLAVAVAPSALAALTPVEVPLPTAGVDALAYGGGRVVWATHHGAGPVRLFSAQPGGAVPQLLASIRRSHPSSPDLFVSLAVNDAGFIVSVRDAKNFAVDPSGVEVYYGEVVAVGGFDGSLHTVVRCRPGDNADDFSFPSVETAADGQRFAFGGVSCGVPASIDTVTPAGALAAVPHVPRVEGSQAINLSLAGTTLAYMGVTGNGSALIGVSDLATGGARRINVSSSVYIHTLAAQEDGTVVAEEQFASNGGDNVLAAGPAQTTLHPVLKADLAPYAPSILAHGGRLLLDSGGFPDLGLASLAGGPVSSLGAPGVSGGHTLLAFTGDQAAFTSTTCTGAPEVTVIPVPSTGPTSAPDDGCSLTITSTRLSVGPAGRTALHISCPLGCRGALILNVSVPAITPREFKALRLSHSDGGLILDKGPSETLGQANFTLAPGAGNVRFRLDRTVRRILAHHRGGIAAQVGIDRFLLSQTASISGTSNVLVKRG